MSPVCMKTMKRNTPNKILFKTFSYSGGRGGEKTLSRLKYKNVIFSLRLTFSFTATTLEQYKKNKIISTVTI